VTFLELCQRLREKAGVSGSGPSDVVSQSGELALLVNLVADAWRDIQNDKETWKFLWVQNHQLTIVPSGGPYNVANFLKFCTRPVIDNYTWLTEWQYQAFKDAYDVTLFGDGRPNRIIVQPDRTIAFDSNPTTNHTVTFDYYRTPQELAVKEDVPLMPARHHMTIVWLALLRYAEGEEASNLITTADREYTKAKAALQKDQLPKIQLQLAPFA